MNRMEFMQALRDALCDISSEEREAALQYYNDYLDDAGPENEQYVLNDWGSPEKLAESIRSGMDGRLENGEFTEKGFSSGEERQCPARQTGSAQQEQAEYGKAGERHRGGINGWKWLAIALLCILLGPVCVPAVAGLAAGILAVLVAAVAVVAALAGAGIILFVAGIAAAIAGVVMVFTAPSGAAVLFGAGLVVAAVGALFTLLFGWLLVKCSVGVFRGFVELCRRPFHRSGKGGVR